MQFFKPDRGPIAKFHVASDRIISKTLTLLALTFAAPQWAAAKDPFVFRLDADAIALGFIGDGISDAPRTPSDVAAGDFNSDGATDLAVAYALDDEVRWFWGDGAGGFQLKGVLPVGVHPGPLNDLPRQFVCRDFDRDGFLDLALICSGNPNEPFFTAPSLGLLWGTPTGGFEPFQPVELAAADGLASPLFSLGISAGTIDQDDLEDLVVSHFDSGQISLVSRRGGRHWATAATFSVDTAGSGPVETKIKDLNFDGVNELIVVNRADLQVWRGDGHGNFPSRRVFATGINFTAADFADLDRNGAWDLLALDGSANELRIFMNLTPGGEFTSSFAVALVSGQGPIDLLVYDANLDGFDDVAVIYLFSGGGEVLFGFAPMEGQASFGGGDIFATSAGPRTIRAADLDNDRRLDLIVVNEGDAENVLNRDLVFELNALPEPSTDMPPFLSGLNPAAEIGAGLAHVRGLAWDAGRRSLWTFDRKRRHLARLPVDGGAAEIIPFEKFGLSDSNEGFLDPTDLDVDSSGALWITDRLRGRVVSIDPAGSAIRSFGTAGLNLGRPAGIAFDRRANRLFISDERSGRVSLYSAEGQSLGSFMIQPMRDLAFDSETSTLWGIPEFDPGSVFTVGVDSAATGLEAPRMFPIAAIAPILAGERARSITLDPARRRFWIVTERGALVEATYERELISITELTLLNEIRAVVHEPEGLTLLADSGLMGTLVRLDRSGRVIESIVLNDPRSPAPIRIDGLTRGPLRIFVLDSRRRAIEVLTRSGRPIATIRLEGTGGRALKGLHFQPTVNRLLIGSAGRVLAVPAHVVQVGGEFPAVVEPARPIPATLRPDSISGADGDGLFTLFSAGQNVLTIWDLLFGLQAVAPLPETLPARFHPLAAGATEEDGRGLTLVGTGPPSFVTTRPVFPRVVLGAQHWNQYD